MVEQNAVAFKTDYDNVGRNGRIAVKGMQFVIPMNNHLIFHKFSRIVFGFNKNGAVIHVNQFPERVAVASRVVLLGKFKIVNVGKSCYLDCAFKLF